jgi:hypothetical protein
MHGWCGHACMFISRVMMLPSSHYEQYSLSLLLYTTHRIHQQTQRNTSQIQVHSSHKPRKHDIEIQQPRPAAQLQIPCADVMHCKLHSLDRKIIDGRINVSTANAGGKTCMHACAFECTADTHTVIEQCERIKNVTNSVLTHRFLLVVCREFAHFIIGLDTVEVER